MGSWVQISKGVQSPTEERFVSSLNLRCKNVAFVVPIEIRHITHRKFCINVLVTSLSNEIFFLILEVPLDWNSRTEVTASWKELSLESQTTGFEATRVA